MQTNQETPTPTLTPTPTITTTSTLDPTANWKTYTSTLDGYQLRYPANWYINEDTSTGQVSFSDLEFSEDIVYMYSQGVILYIKSDNELSPLFPAKKGDKISGIENFPCLKIDQFMLNGLTTVEFSCEPPADWEADYALSKDYAVAHNNKYIRLSFVSSIQKNLDNKITDQILSTFKFIEPTPSIKLVCPTTEWVDCMPGPDMVKPQCDATFLTWAKANCPGFKGAAL